MSERVSACVLFREMCVCLCAFVGERGVTVRERQNLWERGRVREREREREREMGTDVHHKGDMPVSLYANVHDATSFLSNKYLPSRNLCKKNAALFLLYCRFCLISIEFSGVLFHARFHLFWTHKLMNFGGCVFCR